MTPEVLEVTNAVTSAAASDGTKRRWKLLFLLPYPLHTVPGQRLKFEQYFAQFEKMGFEITVRCFFDRGFYKILYERGRYVEKILLTIRSYVRRWRHIREAKSYDAVYVHLWVAPFEPPLYEYLLKRTAVRLIYDIDDLIFLRQVSPANRVVRFLKGRKNVHYLMAVSDHVIVCTEYLKQYALRFNRHVTNIPSTIDTTLYVPPDRGSTTRGKTLCIGWSGSHSTVVYLALLKEVFEELKKRYEFTLKVIGHPKPPLGGLEVAAQEWRLETEVKDLQEIDIGVYPLPHNEWVLGKSGLKALQYMSLGIPTVATSIGATLEIIDDGHNGFLAGSREEWLEKLSRLIEDAELRRRMGANARKTVEERYSLKINAKNYLGILESVCNGTGRSR